LRISQIRTLFTMSARGARGARAGRRERVSVRARTDAPGRGAARSARARWGRWREAARTGRELLVLGGAELVEEGELARAEEDFGDPELVVRLVEAERHQQDLAEGGRVERGDRARHHLLVPVVEVVVRAARRETGVHEAERLDHPRAAQLREDAAAVEGVGRLARVWVDAAHKVRVGLAQHPHQLAQLLDELARDGLEARRGRAAAALAARRRAEHLPQEGVGGGRDDVLEVGVQHVVVLVEERGRAVGHLARVVADNEGLVGREPLARAQPPPAQPRPGEGLVGAVRLVDLARERLVRRAREPALLVKDEEDAGRDAGGGALLEHRDALLVVRLVDRHPADGLADVDLLLGFKDARVEVALQLLVRKVDAELLEAVGLEDLEAEDVEHRNRRARLRLRQQARVDLADEPVEERRVQPLAQRVARVRGVGGLDRDLDGVLARAADGHRALRQPL
jgi:hypothetical protein